MKAQAWLMLACIQTAGHSSDLFAQTAHSSAPAHDFTYAFQLPRGRLADHPYVMAPVPELQIQKQVFYLPNALAAKVQLNGTACLIIPADAFETSNGKACTGQYEISYREFKDPLSILLSGIPMRYDSGGRNHFFQSAGMFEIQASQKGKALRLKKGKYIELQFSPTDHANYQFYRLNERNGNWTYLGNANEQGSTASNTSASAADLNPQQMKPGDSTSFQSRYQQSDYYFTFDQNEKEKLVATSSWYSSRKLYPKGNPRIHRSGRIQQGTSLFRLQAELNEANEVVYIHVTEAPGHLFFPEMYTFYYRRWALEKPIPYREFNRNYRNGRKYHDIRVYYTEGEEQCVLELKHTKGYNRLNIDVIKTAHGSKKQALKRFSRAYGRYSIALKNRENCFNSQLMTRKAALSINKKIALVNSSFRLNALGIYNCDRIYNFIAPITLFAHIKSGEKAVESAYIYSVDSLANAAFCFWDNRLTLSQSHTLSLLVVDTKGSLYVVKREQLQALKSLRGKEPEAELQAEALPLHLSASELALSLGLPGSGTTLTVSSY